MTLFAKASYTIIRPKQLVLVCKRLSLWGKETISYKVKQVVLLLRGYAFTSSEGLQSIL